MAFKIHCLLNINAYHGPLILESLSIANVSASRANNVSYIYKSNSLYLPLDSRAVSP
jgi:hypothetical protein